MTDHHKLTVDGSEAVTLVAHRLSEVIAIYPITPSSAMGELSDEWSKQGRRNLWGNIPEVVEMLSEAGAAGVGAASRRPGDDLHRVARTPLDDPQHVLIPDAPHVKCRHRFPRDIHHPSLVKLDLI
jgi:hypothetical protein